MAKSIAAGTILKVGAVVVGNLTSIGPPGMQKPEIPASDFASTAEEFLMGIPDHGEMQIEGLWNYTDAGQLVLLGDANDPAAVARSFVIEFTRQVVKFTFSAWVKSFTPVAQVGGAYTFTSTLRVTGAVTVAALP